MNKEQDTKQKHILVVEDTEDMSAMLVQLLKRAGYSVALAEDGQSALTQAEEHSPDLILTDLLLPDISGWEVIARLRKMPEFRKTPIIALTALVSPADRERALAVGSNVHIGKPFSPWVLLRSIADLLASEQRTPLP
jgi:two-component system, cell cycle response regulator DivK